MNILTKRIERIIEKFLLKRKKSQRERSESKLADGNDINILFPIGGAMACKHHFEGRCLQSVSLHLVFKSGERTYALLDIFLTCDFDFNSSVFAVVHPYHSIHFQAVAVSVMS